MNNIENAFRGSAGLTKDYYEALVTAAMEPHRLAVKRAKQRKDSLEIEAAVYSDLHTKLKGLQDAVKALRQGDSSVFAAKRVNSSDPKYVSASAGSAATNATYAIHIDHLAIQHSMWSDKQPAGYTLDLEGAGNTAQFVIGTGSDVANQVEVTVHHGDKLSEISAKINQAVQEAIDAQTLDKKHAFTASIVDNRLILNSASTGTAYALTASDVDGTVLTDLNIFAAANEIQAQDASFTVNGIQVTRSSNTGLADVIEHVTLDLKQAHGLDNNQTVTVAVEADQGAATAAINTFINRLNDFAKWMAAKSGVKAESNGTYSRGVLASNFGLKGLRQNLIQKTFATWSGAPGGALYTRLDQLGLKLGEGLHVSLEASKLSDALSADLAGVVNLFESTMGNLQEMLVPYTEGTTNQVDRLKSASETALKTQSDRIKRLEISQQKREEVLRNQIATQFAAISRYNDQGRYLMTTMFNAYA